MKKHLLFLFAICAFTQLKAQETPIIITSTSINFKAGVFNYKVTDATTLTKPTTGDNQTWDYSARTAIDSTQRVYFKNTNPAFNSSVLVTDTNYDYILPSRVIYYKSYIDLSPSALSVAGIYIMKVDYSIGALTGNPNDTFYVDSSSQVMNAPNKILALPLTAHDKWVSTYSTRLDFKISLGNFAMDKTPCYRVSHYVISDTVSGWGKLSTPSTNGQFQKVLMVQEKEMRIDSFYVNGAPASPMLLGAFGLKQADTSYYYGTYFYREGSPKAMMTIGYGTDATYNTPTGAVYSTDPYEIPASIKVTTNTAGIQIYPNPVVDGSFNLQFSKTSNAPYIVELRNVVGQVVYATSISGTTTNQQIQLPAKMASGMYFVNISTEGSKVYSGKVLISK